MDTMLQRDSLYLLLRGFCIAANVPQGADGGLGRRAGFRHLRILVAYATVCQWLDAPFASKNRQE